MARLSACIEMLFGEEPDFLKRIDLAADCGLTAVEFWGWGHRDIKAIKAKTEERGLRVAAFCTPGGQLADPATHADYIQGLRDTLPVAQELGCNRIITTVGDELEGVSRSEQAEHIVAALSQAAPIAADAGVVLCLEPLNILVDHAGYFLWSSKEAFAMVDRVSSPGLKLLFDIYHQQISEGNLIQNITANIDKIAHFHLADVPGRTEPGTGEINYRNVFRAIKGAGYTGAIGMEYRPSTGDSKASLEHVLALRAELGLD